MLHPAVLSVHLEHYHSFLQLALGCFIPCTVPHPPDHILQLSKQHIKLEKYRREEDWSHLYEQISVLGQQAAVRSDHISCGTVCHMRRYHLTDLYPALRAVILNCMESDFCRCMSAVEPPSFLWPYSAISQSRDCSLVRGRWVWCTRDSFRNVLKFCLLFRAQGYQRR